MKQADRILNAIRDAGSRGIENWKLVEIALNYTMRISELRRLGYDIRAEQIKKNGKASGTFVYQLHGPKTYTDQTFKIPREQKEMTAEQANSFLATLPIKPIQEKLL